MILLLLLPVQPVIPSTHWIMTEAGKIQAQPDSVFFMRQPHDFVAFLHQEQRVLDTTDLHLQLSSIRGALDESHSAEVPDVEAQLLAEDPDCQLAGRPLTQYDLYVSTLVPLRSSVLESMESDSDVFIDEATKLKEPWCSRKEIMQEIRLPLVDELRSIAQRNNLSMQGELGLAQIVLDEGKIKLSHYGHLVAYGLNKEKTNWVTYNLAGLYWRMKGNAFESIECLRRAIHFGQSTCTAARPVSLISLGNVLHQSLQPEDAAKVLEMAVDHDPTESVGHYTLGNVYAVLMQFNKSIASFDYALRITPDLPWVKKRRAAVKCHQKLELSLENQHSKLQKTLEELRAYQKQHERWAKMNSNVNSVQAPLENRVASRQSYERFTFMTEGKIVRPQGCYETLEHGKKFIECVVNSHDESNKLLGQTIYRRNTPTATEKVDEDDPKNFKEVASPQPTHEAIEMALSIMVEREEEDVFGPANMPMGYEELDRSKPTQRRKYPNLKNKYAEKKKYSSPDWPDKEECKAYVSRFPDWTQLPSVYLPARNKGFDMERMIKGDISVKWGGQHPLPWYPPLCDAALASTVKLPTRYSYVPRVSGSREKHPDDSIKEKLLESFGQAGENVNIAELGARLKSAREAGLWPGWLLNTAAANYWRIIGNAGASSDCFILALAEAPVAYRDLVLTNLGALLYKLGQIEPALKLVQESLAVSSTEPETHFLLANLYAAKGNMSGSISHYRLALQLEPGYPGGLAQLRIPSCYVKFHLAAGRQEETAGEGANCRGDFFSHPSPPKSCSSPEGDRNQEERTFTSIQGSSDYIFCRDGHCQFVTQSFVERFQAAEKPEEPVEVEVPQDKTCPPPAQHADDTTTKIVQQEDMDNLPTGAIEIATIALTENDANEEIFGPTAQSFKDDDLPEILLKVKETEDWKLLEATPEKCEKAKKLNWKAFTSTWLSVSAKDINFAEHLSLPPTPHLIEPFCAITPVSARSLDHLVGMKRRKELKYSAEVGLLEAFQSLAGKVDKAAPSGLEKMATSIGVNLLLKTDSWVLSTAAALYWRVKGNAAEALECVRHSLYHCPDSMRDIPLLSLANVMHRTGLYNDAVIATNLALELSPAFVVTHFTMANVYTSMGQMGKAKQFYISTLELQSTFEPAVQRLLAILCGHTK